MNNGCDLEPLGNAVILKEIEKKTDSGIVLPDSAVPHVEGEVISVGPSCRRVKAGDKIFYCRHHATRVSRGDEQFTTIYETNIPFRIEPKKKNGKIYECDLIPLYSRVLIKEFSINETRQGILIANDGIPCTEGRVVAVGDLCTRINVGDVVLYGRVVKEELVRNGEKYILVFESNIPFKVSAEKVNSSKFVKREK
jgi:co-chaperonin GroES (HSP10)